MGSARWLVVMGLVLGSLEGGVRPAVSGDGEVPAAGAVAVPYTLDHNRTIVDVQVERPDGSTRTARAWVDLGNDALVVAEPLARELGLDLSALPPGPSWRAVPTTSPAPPLRLGGTPLAVGGVPVRVSPRPHVLAGVGIELQVPAAVFRGSHLVLDHPARRLTVARPGVLEPLGAPVPCRVNPTTGLLMVQVALDGDSTWLGVDNGSAGTWVADSLVQRWRARHPGLPVARGAAGSANFFGFALEKEGTLAGLPTLGIGPLVTRDVAVLGLGPDLFDWYSKKSAGAVQGFLGGNVLGRFRLEIDFPGQTTWWSEGPPLSRRDLDIVGLTLAPRDSGGVVVVAAVTKDGRPLVAGTQAGDRVVAVDGRDVSTAPMGVVVDALRGTPGTTRLLRLDRQGQPVTVRAPVTRLP